MKFYHKEYDEIKHIPLSRFWGYMDFISNYNKSQDELLNEQQAKISKAKNIDWDEEVKELKYDTGKNKNNN